MARASAVLLAAGACRAGATAIPDGYVIMPGGRLHHRSCVHAWDHDVHVHKDGTHTVVTHPNGTATRFPPCPHPPLSAPRASAGGGGEVENSGNASDPMGYVMMVEPSFKRGDTSWACNWLVPPAPSKPSGIVYLFNGLQPGNNIYQPVLQWGGSCHGTSSWTFVSYFVGGDGSSQCGKQVKVKPGDMLRGIMKKASGGWDVISCGTPACKSPSKITSNHGDPTWGDLALEMYGGGACSSYPNNDGVTFIKNEILDASGKKITPTWKNGRPGGSCGNKMQVIDAATVKLAWNGPPSPPGPPPPPPTRYHCTKSSYTCALAQQGHSTEAKCKAACHAP